MKHEIGMNGTESCIKFQDTGTGLDGECNDAHSSWQDLTTTKTNQGKEEEQKIGWEVTWCVVWGIQGAWLPEEEEMKEGGGKVC